MLKSYYALGNCLFYTSIPTYVLLSMDPSFPHFLMNRRNKSSLDKKSNYDHNHDCTITQLHTILDALSIKITIIHVYK